MGAGGARAEEVRAGEGEGVGLEEVLGGPGGRHGGGEGLSVCGCWSGRGWGLL